MTPHVDLTGASSRWRAAPGWLVLAVAAIYPLLNADVGSPSGTREYAWLVLSGMAALGIVDSPPVCRWLRSRAGGMVWGARAIIVTAIVIGGAWLLMAPVLVFLLAVPLADAALSLPKPALGGLVVLASFAVAWLALVPPDAFVIWLLAVAGPVMVVGWGAADMLAQRERRRRSDSLASHRAELLNVVATTDLATHGLDHEQVAAAAVNGSLGLGVAAAVLYDIDTAAGTYRPVETAGSADVSCLESGRLDADDAIGRTSRSGVPTVVVGDRNRLPAGSRSGGFDSAWVVPIFDEDEVTAALCALDGRARHPDAGELVTLRILADRITAGRAYHRQAAAQRAAIDQLEEAERLKAEFIANTAHQLRTPATVIKAANELLLARREELDSETRRQLRAKIDEHADELGALLDSLQSYDPDEDRVITLPQLHEAGEADR